MTTGDRPKAIRIEIEYEDGLIDGASGDDAEAVVRSFSEAIAIAHVHGGYPFRGSKLKVVRPARAVSEGQGKGKACR